jgi:hypothetical protein
VLSYPARGKRSGWAPYIPLIVENVRGAQKWVGQARWHYGSFYLWGDVPALMPMTFKAAKVPAFRFDGSGKSFQTASVEATAQKSVEGSCARLPGAKGGRISGWPHKDESDAVKVPSEAGRRTDVGKGARFTSRDCGDEGTKSGAAWFDGKPRDKMLGDKGPAAYGSRSNSRKAAAAMITKIPFPLAQHIARTFKPGS